MNRIQVNSSQIASVGHDAATNTLEIEFKNNTREGQEPRPNSVYQYKNVSIELHAQLIGAESVGSFFYKNIKPFKDKYPYNRIS
jgi:hypothetical protein